VRGLSTPKVGVDRLEFDVAIIDEAGRTTIPELLIPLLRCRKAILIGDHYQFPPCVSPLLLEESARDVLLFLARPF
jgi:superfamily I DNA and/or RNA helicase